MRPASIILFERLYLGAIGIGLINAALSWSQTQAMMANPEVNPAGFGTGFILTTMAFSVAIPLLLWYFIARRGSNIAKWILVVLFGIGLIMMLATLGGAAAPSGLSLIITLVITALQGVAIFMLFKPDAVAWLSSGTGPTNPDTFR
jgi:F0F1-type ATP synthase membrane subunit c/vacuolar-type H+-ATPase subunit K